MAEYINREETNRALSEWCILLNSPHLLSRDDTMFLIDNIPAADVAPVVHGHFVHDGPRFTSGVDWWHCSNCGRLATEVETRFDYCPNCGARMDYIA